MIYTPEQLKAMQKAAPDMLEALECCLPVLKALCADGYIGNYKQTQKVIEAIAKAKGENQ